MPEIVGEHEHLNTQIGKRDDEFVATLGEGR